MIRTTYLLPLLLISASLRADESAIQLIQVFERTKTIDEFKGAYRLLITRSEEITADNYAQFVQHSIDVAYMYKAQVEQEQKLMAKQSRNDAMVNEGIWSIGCGMYGLSRLAVVKLMPHHWWLRWPWFPISWIIAKAGYHGSIGYKFVLGFELLGGLTGLF